MQIKSIKINNLRNLQSVSIEAAPRLNLLVGHNGAGKTSVLESLLVLAKGRSFRTGQISSLIGPDGNTFVVNARVEQEGGQLHTLGFERSRENWRARRDGSEVKLLGDMAADLPLVLMEPNSHLLVSGPPEGRRRFMDWAVFHVEHSFLPTWRRYNRAIKQRNAALRSGDVRMVQSLDPLVADLGGEIDVLRRGVADRLGMFVEANLKALSPGLQPVKIDYRPGWRGESLMEALEAAAQRDMERGSTGPGPHRADITLKTNDKPAREIFSRGEQKVLSAALLLSQAEVMGRSGHKPTLLLDDLASEFDERHRQNVLDLGLDKAAQVWVTGTSTDPYNNAQKSGLRVFHVEHGKISQETSN